MTVLFRRAFRLSGLTAALLASGQLKGMNLDPKIGAFIENNCADCHNDIDREAKLDLTSFSYDPEDSANFATWVKINDRVKAGEMPPRKEGPA